MTKSDKITHLAIMIRGSVEHTRSSLLNEDWGYVSQLDQIASEGGFITGSTEEALGLTSAATDLVRIAQRLLLVRDRLIENDKPKLAVVS